MTLLPKKRVQAMTIDKLLEHLGNNYAQHAHRPTKLYARNIFVLEQEIKRRVTEK